MVDTRGRLTLPNWILSSVSWAPKIARQRAFEVLAVCAEHGAMRLVPWDTNAPAILARRQECIQKGDLRGVNLIEYRYRRLAIPRELRPTIGMAGAAHLGLRPGSNIAVYVALEGEEIVLMSQEYRDRQLEEASAAGLFEGLP